MKITKREDRLKLRNKFSDKARLDVLEKKRIRRERRAVIEAEFNELNKDKPLIQEVTSDELFEYSFKKNRDRYKKFPDRLPTKGRFPFPPDEHKLIGLFESKQTLYLLVAHAYNRIMGRTNFLLSEVERLTKEIEELKKSIPKVQN